MVDTNTPDLHLHEIILLLALKTDTGAIAHQASCYYSTIMGAAVLTDLFLKERIHIGESTRGFLGMKSEPKVSLLSSKLTGNPVMDECLSKISNSAKERSTSHWVQSFGNIRNLIKKSALPLVEKGILDAQERKIFFLFNKTYYPTISFEERQAILHQIEQAIFTNTETVDERTSILIALLKEAEMLKMFFDRKALKAHKKRIQDITEGTFAGKAAKKAIEAANAAAMVAISAGAVAATSG
ncbi:GPP34 family phosphoprotein [Kordiimonas sp. SCSIO 12610]|uniref:GOLPH3/VPS74 family protein n=1 Tax=Kordiimonas sp. SCSIO 12610 TaxID=2829597 RepID=UPI00210A496E|nr:GPP34 family phosphoprotein [Kordiimonas sp. SCSIO 12610]UTW56811.1 GPP34 family phosphoprotein [Kordiimonas sp. SCSIO 12610]